MTFLSNGSEFSTFTFIYSSKSPHVCLPWMTSTFLNTGSSYLPSSILYSVLGEVTLTQGSKKFYQYRYTKSYVFGALKAPKRENLLVPLILILTSIKNFFHLSLELYKMLWLI
jgi:hypothetical protein